MFKSTLKAIKQYPMKRKALKKLEKRRAKQAQRAMNKIIKQLANDEEMMIKCHEAITSDVIINTFTK